MKNNLFGMPLDAVKKTLVDLGEKPFRAKQILPWIYQHRVTDFEAMTNLSKPLRQKLQSIWSIELFSGVTKKLSQDGSIKYLFQCHDGKEVESVFMPMNAGYTLCISSQVGCAQACSFCLTATMGFVRNLTAGEIVGQVWYILNDQGIDRPVNIVMMGMGEPLLNIKNVELALELFFSPLGFELSPKRVTVSTSGHVTHINRLAKLEIRPRLAISLNATTDEQRDAIMPVNQQWPIQELLDACRDFPLGSRDRITFEYVVMKGFNDSLDDAKRLVKLLMGIRCKVNLIPFNETDGLPYKEPDLETLEAFQARLNRSGVRNTIRWSKGRDIGAACGQLAVKKGVAGATRVIPGTAC